MRENARAARDERRPVLPHDLIGADVLRLQVRGKRDQTVCQALCRTDIGRIAGFRAVARKLRCHLIERPGEIDGSRATCAQQGISGRQAGYLQVRLPHLV